MKLYQNINLCQLYLFLAILHFLDNFTKSSFFCLLSLFLSLSFIVLVDLPNRNLLLSARQLPFSHNPLFLYISLLLLILY